MRMRTALDERLVTFATMIHLHSVGDVNVESTVTEDRILLESRAQPIQKEPSIFEETKDKSSGFYE